MSAARAKAGDASLAVLPGGKAAELIQAERRFRMETVRLYHAYLRYSVTCATPLLLDMASIWDVDLEKTLRRLRPPRDWPVRPFRKLMRTRYWQSPGLQIGAWERPFRASNSPLVESPDKSKHLRVQLHGNTVDTRLWLGDTLCMTADGLLHAWLPDLLPSTVTAAIVGQRLCEIVDHPAFQVRDYRILDTHEIADRTVIQAEATPVPYTIPWSV